MATTVAAEQQHCQLEDLNLQWLIEEEEGVQEEDGAALERRQSQQQSKQGFSTGVVPPSSSSTSASSSPASIKEIHGNGVGLQVMTALLDGEPAQKQEQVSDDDSHRDEAAQYGVAPEDTEITSAAAETNGEAAKLSLSAAGNNSETLTTGSAAQRKKSVYFDKEEGIWKCHHCSWIKRFSSSWAVPLVNFDGQSPMLMGTETMNQCGHLFVSETKGDKPNTGFSDIKNGASSTLGNCYIDGELGSELESSEFQNFVSNEVNHDCQKPSKNNGRPGPELSPTVHLYEANGKGAQNFGDGTGAAADLYSEKEINSKLTELDVEAVLEKQDTHDLFCPNCNSCITKRVILRKRKRKVHDLDSKAKRDKPEAAVSSELVNIEAADDQGDVSITAAVFDSSLPVTGSFNPQSEPTSVNEPEVFRCLSCFSFFIPAAGKLFGRRTSEPEDLRRTLLEPATNAQVETATNAQMEPATNAHWFFSLFSSNKGAKTTHKDSCAGRKIPFPKNESFSNTRMPSHPGTGHQVPIAENSISKSGDAESTKYRRPKLEGITSWIPSISDSSNSVPQTQTDSSSNMASVGKFAINEESHEFSSLEYQSDFVDEANGLQVGEKISHTSAEGYMPSNVMTDGKLEIGDVGDKGNKENVPIKAQQGGSQFTQSSTTGLDESKSSANQTPQQGGSYLPEFSIWSPALQLLENDTYQKPHMDGDRQVSYQNGSAIPDALQVSNDVSDLQKIEVDSSISTAEQFPLVQKVDGDREVSVPSGSAIPGELQVSNEVCDLQKIKLDSSVSTAEQFTVIQKVKMSPGDKISTAVETNEMSGDVIVTVESSPSHGADNSTISGSTTLEILKSVVYGGLIESITSLGIVSSAVGGGAAPLNIVALGLANLVGGLFILVDKLLELKSYPSSEDRQAAQEDRYQELLGRRANFGVHVAVAILSFLIFGSVPLSMYGFLARKSYKTDVIMAAIFAASLLCVILLASAEVYTRKPPKSYVQTVAYYVTMAIAASGISYVVGDLVKDLLEKFNQPQTGLNIFTGLLDDTGNVKPSWSNY